MQPHLNPVQKGRLALAAVERHLQALGYTVTRPSAVGRRQVLIAQKGHERREIIVRSLWLGSYFFIEKEKLALAADRFIALVKFDSNGHLSDIFFIPSLAWKNPNWPLVDYPYGKPGQKSKPEYGILLGQAALGALQKYRYPQGEQHGQ